MKKQNLHQEIREHAASLKIELARLQGELANAHDLTLHLKPGLEGRILEVAKEIEYLESVLHD